MGGNLDVTSGGGSSWNVDLAGASQTTESQETTLISTHRRTFFDDTQDTVREGRTRRYEAYSDSPTLPTPGRAAPKAELYYKETADTPPSTEASISQQTLGSDRDFVSLVKQLINSDDSLTEEEKQLALFKLYIPDYSANPKVSEALAKAVADANARMLEQDPSWVQPASDPQVFNVGYSEAVEGAFAKAIIDRRDSESGPLTEADLTDMEYALYHPDKASSKAKAMLEELGIKSTIKEIMLGAGVGIPEGWNPDSTLYDLQLNEKGDLKFEAAVDAYVRENHLSIEDGYRIKTAYYNPGSTELSEEFAKALEGIKKEALSGMPAGWEPEPNAKLWNGIISANFRHANESFLTDYLAAHPELKPEDALLIRKALNGETEGLSESILTAAATIKKQAIEAIQTKYGVDETWVPTGAAISETPPTGAAYSSLKMLSDMQAAITKYASKLPQAQRVLVMDFLKSVSEALSQLQETIYRMEIAEAEGQSELSRAQQEAQQFKIDQKMAELKKQEEEQKKIQEKQSQITLFKDIMQIVTPIIAAISIVATIASFGTLGPVAVALIVLMTTCSCIDMIPGVDGKMAEWTMNIIATGLRKICEASGVDSKTAKWADFAGKLFTVILVVAATKGAGAQTAIMTGTQYFSSSNLIADPLVAEDVDPMTTAIVCGSVNAGVSMGAIGSCMAMKSAGTVTADTLNATSKAFSDAATASTNAIQRACYNMMAAFYKSAASSVTRDASHTLRWISRTTTAMQVTNSGMQAGTSALEYKMNLAQGELALIKKLFESKDLAMRDLIEALKQQVQKLLQILNDLMTWLPTVGESQADLWDKNRTPQVSV